MSEPIEVPDSAFENKPWFNSCPTPEVIREIKDYIRAHGTPHLWRGHSHSAPMKGGRIVYVDEFDVPTFGYTMDRVAPCPCCSPRARKYKSGGKIAWFPDEEVIRLIGPQCYRSLDAEGHEEAEHDLRVRLERERHSRYLISQLPLLPAIIGVGDEVVEMAAALDSFRADLRQRVQHTLGMRMWEAVRGGVLNLNVASTEVVAGRDGQHHQRTIMTHERYSSIEGWEILDPRATKIAPGLKVQVDRLQVMLFELTRRRDVRDTDDLSLRRAAKTMAQGRKAIATAIERIASERRFVGPLTVPTMRTWGKLDNAVLRVSFRRRDRDLLVGYDPNHAVRIPVPEAMERTLPTLPHLAEE